nr:ankyrin repeat-containing domain, PGG domain, Gag-polypeptide of LTR copia-type [Tanacetum cinerariifolium]
MLTKIYGIWDRDMGYAIVNHHKVSKKIWDRVKLLMQGTKLSLQEKECLDVPVFNQGDDPIVCLNKTMAFLTVVASSSYKSNATTLGGNNVGEQANVVKCYNCQGEGHIARKCTQPKKPRNAAWFKEKTEDLDAYDSDYDDVSNAKAVLMSNLSNYGSDVISEVPHHEAYHTDMDNQISIRCRLVAIEDDLTSELEHLQSIVNELDHMVPEIYAQYARLDVRISRIEARMEKIKAGLYAVLQSLQVNIKAYTVKQFSNQMVKNFLLHARFSYPESVVTDVLDFFSTNIVSLEKIRVGTGKKTVL